jgi:hypothetical protein
VTRVPSWQTSSNTCAGCKPSLLTRWLNSLARWPTRSQQLHIRAQQQHRQQRQMMLAHHTTLLMAAEELLVAPFD